MLDFIFMKLMYKWIKILFLCSWTIYEHNSFKMLFNKIVLKQLGDFIWTANNNQYLKKISILLLIISSLNASAFSFRFNLFNQQILATGGTITYTDSNGLNPRTTPPYAGGYTVHTFTTGTSTFTLSSNSAKVDYLIVAGGASGGGGAGGLIQGTQFNINKGTYSITVGASAISNSNGNDTTALGFTAKGGGTGGHKANGAGSAGGSGGGGAAQSGAGGGVIVAGQGNVGGSGSTTPSSQTDSAAAGGGGAGSAAGNQGFTNSPGAGGEGLQLSISGSPTWYAAGGGGGRDGQSGSNGASGIVIIRHKNTL